MAFTDIHETYPWDQMRTILTKLNGCYKVSAWVLFLMLHSGSHLPYLTISPVFNILKTLV